MTGRAALALAVTLAAGALPAGASGVPVDTTTLDVYRVCIVTGVTGATAAVTDATVDQTTPTVNHGGASTLDVQSRSNRARRSHVRFDLAACSPAIPSSATVVSATLDLFVTALPAGCRTIDVFRVSSSWAETTITWNTQPAGSGSNLPPSGQATIAVTMGTAGCDVSAVNTYASFPVTRDVQAFVTGGTPNHGWLLRDDVENGGQARLTRFAAADTGDATRGPRLVVTYRP